MPSLTIGGTVSSTGPGVPLEPHSWKDVRMRGFQDRTELAAAVALLMSRIQPLGCEHISITDASGRVLAEDVVSDVAVPAFDRAAMDGYALRGGETFGAGPYNPLEFTIIGEGLPGRMPSLDVGPGQALRIMTGAPMPRGADAVLQAEAAAEITDKGGRRVRISEPVPPGRHVGHIGEDIAKATRVLAAGRRLRPQDLGVLASIGASPVAVIRTPRVAILATGDELLPSGAKPEGCRIVDSNSVMLAGLVARDGGRPVVGPLLPDRRDAVREALLKTDSDLVLISGGSSVGKEDHAPRVLAEVGELFVHGLALRPASPAGFGFLPGPTPRLCFLLPGNPASCLCAYDLLAGRAVRRLGGRPADLPYRRRNLPLARKMVSAVGRVDYVRVQVRGSQVEPLSTSGASILSSTTRADGFVLVPADAEGYPAGTEVEVFLYD
jgi:molybdopterin molybdotransferase